MRLIFFPHQPQSPVCLTRVCIIRLFSLMNYQSVFFIQLILFSFFLFYFNYFLGKTKQTTDCEYLSFVVVLLSGGAIWFSFNFFLFPPGTIASLPNTGMHHSTFLFFDECTKVYFSFRSFNFFFSFFLLFIYLREDNSNDRLWVLIFCCCFIKWGCYLIFL